MELHDRLHAHMDLEMAATRQTNLGGVMERGEVIRRRRRLVSATLPAAAVLVIVVGVMFFDGGPPAGRDVSNVEAVAASNAQLSVHQASLDWQVQPSTLGFQQQNVAADGILYTLSTAPGARFKDFPNGDIPKAIYTSADGLDWAAHPVGGSWVSAIAATDGLLYAVGTGPGAEADSVVLRIEVSRDQGQTFEGRTIPLEGMQPNLLNTRVMAAGDGILATASSRFSADPLSLVPPEVLEGGEVEPMMVEEPQGGIAIFPFEAVDAAHEACFGAEPEACAELVENEATHFFSWDELGLEDDGRFAGEISTHSAYWSEDGQPFQEVEYPFPDGFIEGVHSVGDRSVVAVGGAGGNQLFSSRDARSWQALDVPSLGWIQAMGEVDGEAVIVAQSPDGQTPSIFHAPDLSGPWEEIPLSDLIDLPDREGTFVWVTAATVGKGGVALNLSMEQQTQRGNPIRGLLDRMTGSPDPEEAAPVEPVNTQTSQVMLTSRDLTSWSAVPTSDLGPHVDSLLTAPDGRLIAYASVPGDDGRPVRQQYSAQP